MDMQAFTVAIFKQKLQEDITILDTRNATIFTEGFVPGSIFIGLEGRFVEWATSLLPFEKPLLLITDIGKEEETKLKLGKIGFTKIEGFLAGGFEAWNAAGEKVDMIINVDADEVAMDIPFDANLQVVDVRRENEFAEGHIKGAINMPLDDMTDLALLASFEDNQNLYVQCGGGYRSVIAASLMKKQGLHNLRNITGGWDAVKEQKKIPVKKDVSALN
jgi:rhodanese-related sulfurtransferase